MQPADSGEPMGKGTTGTVFSIERFSLHNGPGIRSTLFLKGCPLACWWCSNPESQAPEPELAYNRDLCLPTCTECLPVSPDGAFSKAPDGSITVDREKLKGVSPETLRACETACPTGALWVAGEVIEAEVAADRLLADLPFYHESGGGVTISGGDPLQQPQFTVEVLTLLKQAGVHTAVDTAGDGSPEHLASMSEVSDLILFDLKESSPALHRRWTGRNNQAILQNLRYLLARRRGSVRVRYPFVPSLNGTPARVEALIELLRDLGVTGLDLLPYHRLGVAKYTQLGRECPVVDLAAPDRSDIDRAVKQFEDAAIHVSIA